MTEYESPWHIEPEMEFRIGVQSFALEQFGITLTTPQLDDVMDRMYWRWSAWRFDELEAMRNFESLRAEVREYVRLARRDFPAA